MVFLILPAVLEIFPRAREWMIPPVQNQAGIHQRIHQVFLKIAHWRLPRILSGVLISVYLVSFFSFSRLHVSDSPAKIFPATHVLSRDLDYLKESRDWEAPVSLVFQDFSDVDHNAGVLQEFSKNPNVSAIENPYAMERYLTNGLNLGNSAMMKNLWRDSQAYERFAAKDGSGRVLLYLRKTDTASLTDLLAMESRICPKKECVLAGTLVSYTEFGDRVLSTLLKSLGLSLILVSLTLLFLLRAKGARNFVSTLVSVMWGPISIITLFWVLKLPLTYVSCTLASVLVGLSGDNCIQYLFSSRKKESLEEGLDRSALASLQVTLMMASLALVFLASYFASVRELAPLLILGFFLILVGDLWILRSLLRRKATL